MLRWLVTACDWVSLPPASAMRQQCQLHSAACWPADLTDRSSQLPGEAEIPPEVPQLVGQATALCCVNQHWLTNNAANTAKVVLGNMRIWVKLHGHVLKHVPWWLERHELLQGANGAHYSIHSCALPPPRPAERPACEISRHGHVKTSYKQAAQQALEAAGRSCCMMWCAVCVCGLLLTNNQACTVSDKDV